MAENRISYDTLEATGTSYKEKAEEMQSIVNALTATVNEFQSGVENKTSKAFVEKYEVEYKPALENAAKALFSVSKFMTDYATETRENDERTAAGISGS